MHFRTKFKTSTSEGDSKISDISTFTAGVVTDSGTSYILKISDPSKFADFAAKNFKNDADFTKFENDYSNNVLKYNLLGNNNINSYELALLSVLNDSGITILKGNSDFSSWNTVGMSNNQVNYINCN